MIMRIKSLLSQALSTVAIESIAIDGKRRRELEYTFYGQVQSLEQLRSVAVRVESHEQWNLKMVDGAAFKARIRAIDAKRWVLTTKEKIENVLGVQETECEISQDMFEVLRRGCERGYRKTRYYVPVPNSELVWEVDVFLNTLGEPHDWVKLDLEVSDPSVALPKLPVPFLSIITHQSREMTETEKGVVDELWTEHWVALDAR